MARVCICGCGRKLISKTTGQTDYDRKFFDKDCIKKDRRDQLREQRAHNKERRRCSSCRQPVLDPATWKRLREMAEEAGLVL
jgi:hypothetical protein